MPGPKRPPGYRRARGPSGGCVCTWLSPLEGHCSVQRGNRERATPPSPFARRNQRNRRIGSPKIRPAGIASPAVSHTPWTWRDRWRSVPQQGVDPVRMRSGHLRVVSRNASEVPARIHCRTGIRYARSCNDRFLPGRIGSSQPRHIPFARRDRWRSVLH